MSLSILCSHLRHTWNAINLFLTTIPLYSHQKYQTDVELFISRRRTWIGLEDISQLRYSRIIVFEHLSGMIWTGWIPSPFSALLQHFFLLHRRRRAGSTSVLLSCVNVWCSELCYPTMWHSTAATKSRSSWTFKSVLTGIDTILPAQQDNRLCGTCPQQLTRCTSISILIPTTGKPRMGA